MAPTSSSRVGIATAAWDTVGVGVRARYGARYMVPVLWGGRIGWLRSYKRSNPNLAPDLSVLAAAQCT